MVEVKVDLLTFLTLCGLDGIALALTLMGNEGRSFQEVERMKLPRILGIGASQTAKTGLNFALVAIQNWLAGNSPEYRWIGDLGLASAFIIKILDIAWDTYVVISDKLG